MRIAVSTYYPGSSVLHRADARLKIALLAAATVALFLVGSLGGMAACVAVIALLTLMSGVPASRFVPFWIPASVFALCPLLFNGVSFDVYQHLEIMQQYYDVSGLPALEPVALWGNFGFDLVGLLYGVVLGLRIFLLIQLSVLFTLTTAAEDVVAAMGWYLSPLAKLGVPVRDAITAFSLALRFIPLIAEELGVVADSHRMRGAQLDTGSLFARIKAWGGVFIPLFIRLFRRAEKLGTAMEARCYGRRK